MMDKDCILLVTRASCASDSWSMGFGHEGDSLVQRGEVGGSGDSLPVRRDEVGGRGRTVGVRNL